jgi:putative ABC transport system ATP-binding protein
VTGKVTRPKSGTASAPVIDLAGVHKTYRTGSVEFEALRGIDLAITAGEYVAIMGPSGSGKSTLMNVLGCLDIVTSGSYRLNGTDVEELDEEDLARIRNREIGFVFQGFNLLSSLSAWRNVELPLLYAGVHRDERRRRAHLALEKVGLADKFENKPGELSGGQQQRVAVARALVGEPTMILADEPTGNLDSVSTADVLSLFEELNQQGRTIVLITHELEVAQHAKRIVRVRDGLIQAEAAAA